jgi:hypothetical protein
VASPDDLDRLQRIIDRSAATAGPALRRNFGDAGWRMTAEESVAFWGGTRMAAVSTVSASGRVHAAPLEVSLIGSQFHVPTFGDSVRLADHRANARCAITAWDDAYRAVIVYGRVDSLPAGQPPAMVNVVVRPTRIYGIRPPPGHHAALDFNLT